MFAGGLQQLTSGFESMPIDARMRLPRVRFQVIHFLRRPGLNAHDQLEAGIANPQKPRRAPVLSPEGIIAPVGTLDDRGIVPGNPLLQVSPQTPPPERSRSRH